MLILYDGHCRLCSSSVNWIVHNDVHKQFSFKALQYRDYPSVVLILKGKHYERSSAVLRIALHLRFPWPLLGIFFLVPPAIRDSLYRMVARNRKKWFGEHLHCYIP
jgi:predicted DCC family thiol-disulfide oxidoreductase YuxK